MHTPERIPVAGPWITDLEVRYAAEAAEHGWYERAGEFQARFESAFAARVGTRFAAAVPHCTSALHLGLVALGIGPGDEVIVPECTWIATAAPISYVGATPVFVDIDPRTWCIDPESAQRAITPRTRAILAVDLYGGMPDYPALEALATRHGIALLEDAAQAVGAHLGGKPAGSFGRFAAFSFHGSKTLTTGEGGMFVTNEEGLYKEVLFLRDHGRVPGDTSFQNSKIAFKYRMSAVQAAIGLAQTERLDALVEKKRSLFDLYQARLQGLEGTRLNPLRAGLEPAHWMSTLVWDETYPFNKAALMARLKAEGIDSRPFFCPLSALQAYAGSAAAAQAKDRNPCAYRTAAKGINLPSALCLQPSQVERVCDTLYRIFDKEIRK